MFCFPNSDHVMFSREFAFCLFINYAYTCTWIQVNKTTFERNSSLGYHHVVCNGKQNIQAKKSIATEVKDKKIGKILQKL